MSQPLRFQDNPEGRWVHVADLVKFLDAQAAELMTVGDEQMGLLCVWLGRSFSQFANVEAGGRVAVEGSLPTMEEMQTELKQMVDDLREKHP